MSFIKDTVFPHSLFLCHKLTIYAWVYFWTQQMEHLFCSIAVCLWLPQWHPTSSTRDLWQPLTSKTASLPTLLFFSQDGLCCSWFFSFVLGSFHTNFGINLLISKKNVLGILFGLVLNLMDKIGGIENCNTKSFMHEHFIFLHLFWSFKFFSKCYLFCASFTLFVTFIPKYFLFLCIIKGFT